MLRRRRHHAGVDLADRALLRRRVLVLDDRRHLAVAVADDAAVAGGIVELDREQRQRARARVADDRFERLGARQRVGAEQHERHAVGAELRQRLGERVARPQRRILQCPVEIGDRESARAPRRRRGRRRRKCDRPRACARSRSRARAAVGRPADAGLSATAERIRLPTPAARIAMLRDEGREVAMGCENFTRIRRGPLTRAPAYERRRHSGAASVSACVDARHARSRSFGAYADLVLARQLLRAGLVPRRCAVGRRVTDARVSDFAARR